MLKEQILNEIKEAMKAKNAERLSTLRMLSSAMKNAEIEKRDALTDDEVVAVIRTMLKQYRDALGDFEKSGRTDLADQSRKEIAILEAYVPPMMPESEIEVIVSRVIAETNATPADMGKVMGAVMKVVNGRADGNVVRALVQKMLQ